MSQPIWKFVANLGDASPIDYGGLFVYKGEVGRAELETRYAKKQENN